MISIIHPSRGRPEKSVLCLKKWFEGLLANRDAEWIVSLDKNDPKVDDYFSLYKTYYTNKHGWSPITIIENNNRSAVDAINAGAKKSTGNIIIVVSDDTECPLGWLDFLLKWLQGKSDFICKVADGIQPWIITMPIMDRAYYNRFGYIYHPDYQHMFCDTELTCVADLTGRKITSDIMFRHNHYSVTKEQPDAVNKKADATWAQGEKLFLERYKRNFDLKPEDIKGKIQDNGMINWLRNKGR